MASMMKNLMDDFHVMHQLALEELNYGAADIYTLAESMANNCHGKTAQETIDYLRMCFVPAPDQHTTDEELEAYGEVYLILDSREQELRELRKR